MRALRQFGVFLDPYYWRTAKLIARGTLTQQYRNTFLGIAWTLLQPLSMIVVYAIVMPLVMRFPARDYVLYILTTMPLWGFIASALINSSNALVVQGEILKRCLISCTVFPVADVLRLLYVYVTAFLTMYGFGLLFGLPTSYHVLLWPLYLVPVVVTLMALAVGIALAAPYIRDIGELIMVALNVLMWLSAVPYPMAALSPGLQELLVWNPFYILLRPAIALVYEHSLPPPEAVGKLVGLMLLSIAFGYGVHRRCRRNYVYYL